MPKHFKSKVQAAVSAIIEQEKREGIVSPEEISQRHELWIRRNLSRHLEPVYAEAAERMGLDKNKIDKILAQHRDEVSRYLKEQQAETNKSFAVLSKRYEEG